MTAVDELVAFVRAALDEDERVALAADETRPGPWAIRPDSTGVREIYSVSRDEERGRDSNVMPDAWHSEAAEHIVRWDPDRVLAEVEAKRRILDEASAVCDEVRNPTGADHRTNARARQFAYEQVLRLLAQPHAGRDGWREEWRA